MYMFKLRPGLGKAMPINRKIFEEATRREEPYYKRDSAGIMRQYAICPACDNPTSIIGLYSLPSGIRHPFGRHHPFSIPGLADYDEDAYNYCPYASRKWTLSRASRRKVYDERAAEIIQLLRNNFDHVVKIIRKEIGISISKSLAQKMLQTYQSERGYLYAGATLMNIPWIFAYMSDSHSIYGQTIWDESIKSAIIQKVSGAAFDENRLVNGGGGFFRLNLYFTDHSPAAEEGQDETMTLFLSGNRDEPPVYQRLITVKPNLFFDHIQSHQKWRDEGLLQIARDILA